MKESTLQSLKTLLLAQSDLLQQLIEEENAQNGIRQQVVEEDTKGKGKVPELEAGEHSSSGECMSFHNV
jgi:hypothetical protein